MKIGWEISKEDLQNQVENYDKLKVTKSHRGMGALLLVFSMVVSVVLVAFSVAPVEYLYGLVIYAPLAFFVYKGRSWALVAAMVLWTLEKGYQVIGTPNFTIVLVVWWVLYMREFYAAWEVERARKALVVGG